MPHAPQKRPRGSGPQSRAGTAARRQPAEPAPGSETREAHGADTELGDVHEERIMTVSAGTGHVAVAALDVLTSTISVAQFADDTTTPMQQDEPLLSFSMLQLAKLQLAPSTIFVSSKAPPGLVDACRRPLVGEAHSASEQPARSVAQSEMSTGTAHEGESASSSGFRVQLMRASPFHPQQAMKHLEELVVDGMPASTLTPQERLRYLNTVARLDEQLVSALGALLFLMIERQLSGTTDDGCGEGMFGPVHVHSFEELSLSGAVTVDMPTLLSLQIFVDEQHPSNMGIGRSKEGFSVYGMLHSHLTTNMGKRLMRSWLLRPIVALDVINDRQNAVELLVKAPDVAVTLKGILKKIHDVPRLLQRLSDVQTKPNQALQFFKQLLSSFQHLLKLRDTMCDLAPELASEGQCDVHVDQPAAAAAEAATSPQWCDVSISHKLLSKIPSDLQACQVLIEGLIDLDGDQDSDMIVRQGVCAELDSLKDLYYGLPDLLTHMLEKELNRIPSFLARENKEQLWSIVYLPLCGFVMQVSGRPLSDDLLLALPDFARVVDGTSNDGAPSVYYHTDITRKLSSQVGDVLYKIQGLEGTMCSELARRLLQFAPRLRLASAVAAELDCLVAFAACARNHNYCRPVLTVENVLHIEGGRHPLAELLANTFIPNDTEMSAAGRVHVITGPNASGKSVYIKQVAIIAYLAHLGAWVPASKAVVGVVDRIFTRLISQESMQLQQSTFLMDLSQVAAMLNKSTERSLLIVDEFGKGTATSDGVGMLAAFLQHYSSMSHPPRCLATTHFAELFDTKLLPRTEQLCFYTMDVIGSDDGSTGIDDNVEPESVFLYRLVAGHQGPSFGLRCAQMCGLPAEIVARAQEVVISQQQGQPLRSVHIAGESRGHQTALVEQLQQLDLSSTQWRTAAVALLQHAATR